MEIIVQNEVLILSALRAIYWPRKKALILADMHLGKTGYFRSKGIPIPSTVLENDLQRLSLLIDTYQPEVIVVAGDMFHHDYNTDIDCFHTWRQLYNSIDFVLVPGNHDKLLNIDYQALGIKLTEKKHWLDPFTIIHEPGSNADTFMISGHIHPGYAIAGRARQSLRLPCFIVGQQQMILPAFSLFTGLYTGHQAIDTNSYYLIGNDAIFKI
jgi:DNA ligase-associated metallophosphoesterase